MSYPILEQVKIRLKQYQVDKESEELTFDQTEENPYLEQLISQAKEDVKRNRNYPNSYTEDMINKDMEKEYTNYRIPIYTPKSRRLPFRHCNKP